MPSSFTRTIPPGEGERRAQRGYVRQYDLDARLIFEALAAGRLAWIGLADRGAGDFDDLVLGLTDGSIEAYQLKTSEQPTAFSLKTLLLGAPNLLKRKLGSREALAPISAGAEVRTIFACDDYPRTDDKLGASKGATSTARFLETFSRNSATWDLSEWKISSFGPFVESLQKASGLRDREFLRFFRCMRFMPSGAERRKGHQANTAGDLKRIHELASKLPRLVADASGRDRWTRNELLSALGWRDAFGVRHAHQFPIDAFVQHNAETEAALQAALTGKDRGYVSLLGPPGIGKSTLLQSGLLPTPRAVIVRYLAFVPHEGQGLGRAEAFDFLHDLIAQLKQSGLGLKIIPATSLMDLRGQFEGLLSEASARFEESNVRTVFVVDGLDHVPREERPERSFLSELPAPHALPKGVIFVLGSQKLELKDIPPSVRDEANAPSNRIYVAPLPREVIRQWADLAGTPQDIDRDQLYNRTKGHPLSTRYELAALNNAESEEARAAWLKSVRVYGGDVEAFYDRAWHDLEGNDEAREALAFVALAETPLRSEHLDAIVGVSGTNAAWTATNHLLVSDSSGGWSIFHNSFRLYLKAKTSLRFGREDAKVIRYRYGKLAELAKLAADDDPMRWMELRYLARAGDYPAVAALATAKQFRSQFIAGRNSADIQDDIRFAYQAARNLGAPEVLIALVLAQHEIVHRAAALGDEVFDAYLALDNHDAALGLLEESGVTLSAGKGYELVDRYLMIGAATQARKLFEELEPLSLLCGGERVDSFSDGKELESWALRALAFRSPEQVLGSLARLKGEELAIGGFDIEELRARLKMNAVQGEVERRPLLDLTAIAKSLAIGEEYQAAIILRAAYSVFHMGESERAAELVARAAKLCAEYSDADRVDAAALSMRLGREDLARPFMAGLSPPTLCLDSIDHEEISFRASVRHVVQYSRVVAQLGMGAQSGRPPAAPLMAAFQLHLEAIGRLRGEGLAGRRPHREPQSVFRSALDTLSHATGKIGYDYDLTRMNGQVADVVSLMIDTASALGPSVKSALIELLEERIAAGGRLSSGIVRRAVAMKLWQEGKDTQAAIKRLQLAATEVQWTPGEQISEAAQDAAVLAKVGARDLALQTLEEMHGHGLGYARAAKKDPQYIFWQELLSHACRVDPTGRPMRLAVFGRLLGGLGQTEGRSAGRRLVQPFAELATQAGPGWASAGLSALETSGLATWPDLVSGVTVGISRMKPRLVQICAQIYGRIALPWTGEHDATPLAGFLSACPAKDVTALGKDLLNWIETDGHPEVRERLLTEVLDAANLRNARLDRARVERWRRPSARGISSSNDFDPFSAVGSLDELRTVLESGQKAEWSAGRAFERIAPTADYASLKSLYLRENRFGEAVGPISAFIQAAMSASATSDVESEMVRFKAKVQEAGGWTEWFGGAARRYYELDIKLRGAPARAEAFDALAAALAEGREGCENLLPEFCSVLELVCEKPPWPAAWTMLENQIEQFREYQLADALVAEKRDRADEIETLADLLLRASSVQSTPLSYAVRAVSTELVRLPEGEKVVARLLPKMITAKGQVALDGAQIAWEVREVNLVRDAVMPLLPALLQSDDYALVDRGMDLARAWGQPARSRSAALPAVYDLLIPEHVMSRRFAPPSGISSTAAGLWTEDGATWTFALRSALGLTEDATGIDLRVLRSRVAQKMREMGGAEAFGPPALERLEQRFSRLGLRSGYTKLMPAASFVGMRKVVGELVAAGRIDLDTVPFILHQTGAYPRQLTTRSPQARPAGVSPATMINIFSAGSSNEDWLRQVQVELLEPHYPGFVVLAAVATFEKHHFRDRWEVQRYFGPTTLATSGSLWHQLSKLPKVVLMDGAMPLYDNVAPCGVARVEIGPAKTAPDPSLIFCPRLGEMYDLQTDLRDPFLYRDRNGDIVAKTVFWRDGGLLSHESDRGVLGEGCLVVVHEDFRNVVSPYLSRRRKTLAWRETFVDGVLLASSA